MIDERLPVVDKTSPEAVGWRCLRLARLLQSGSS
jgi:hypothetical protein